MSVLCDPAWSLSNSGGSAAEPRSPTPGLPSLSSASGLSRSLQRACSERGRAHGMLLVQEHPIPGWPPRSTERFSQEAWQVAPWSGLSCSPEWAPGRPLLVDKLRVYSSPPEPSRTAVTPGSLLSGGLGRTRPQCPDTEGTMLGIPTPRSGMCPGHPSSPPLCLPAGPASPQSHPGQRPEPRGGTSPLPHPARCVLEVSCGGRACA